MPAASPDDLAALGAAWNAAPAAEAPAAAPAASRELATTTGPSSERPGWCDFAGELITDGLLLIFANKIRAKDIGPTHRLEPGPPDPVKLEKMRTKAAESLHRWFPNTEVPPWAEFAFAAVAVAGSMAASATPVPKRLPPPSQPAEPADTTH